MSDPVPYVPSYSFSGYQATNPTKPLPAPQVDNELANISSSLTETIDALKDIRRSDGQLQNGIVTVDSFSPGLTTGFTLKGAWMLGAHYVLGDGVFYAGKCYRCQVVNDATNDNRPDVDSTTWVFLYSVADLAGAMSIATYDPTGIGANVFARANHTGTQAISTVSGLQAALDTLTNSKLSLTGGTLTGPLDLTFQTLSNPAGLLLRGLLHGGVLSNDAGDLTNDIGISSCVAASDDAVPVLMNLSSALVKRTDAAWAAGSGNGGWLDGASMPNGTGHVFVIRNPTSGAVDVGVSASLAPTLPTGYTQKRRVGSILRESGSIVAFTQIGDYFYRSVRAADVSVTNPGVSAVTRTLSVPTGVQVQAIISVQLIVTTATVVTVIALITALSQADSDPATVGGQVPLSTHSLNEAWRANATFQVITNTSGQVRSRLSQSGTATQLIMHTEGWVDTRGRVF